MEKDTVKIGQSEDSQQAVVTFDVRDSRSDKLLSGVISGFEDDTARLVIDEKEPLRARYRVQDVVLPTLEATAIMEASRSEEHFVANLDAGKGSVIITFSPFRVDFLREQVCVCVCA